MQTSSSWRKIIIYRSEEGMVKSNYFRTTCSTEDEHNPVTVLIIVTIYTSCYYNTVPRCRGDLGTTGITSNLVIVAVTYIRWFYSIHPRSTRTPTYVYIMYIYIHIMTLQSTCTVHTQQYCWSLDRVFSDIFYNKYIYVMFIKYIVQLFRFVSL